MRGIVECPHCGNGVIVETVTTETMRVEPLDASARCGELSPVDVMAAWLPRVPCRLGKGHPGDYHRSETDMVVWEVEK